MNNSVLVISDVDGCLTTGQFIYTADGKVGKIFGVNDHEGIKLLRKNNVEVEFITADKTGLPITMARMNEMKCKCTLVSEVDRVSYIKDKLQKYDKVVFFGDGIGDAYVTRTCNVIFVAPKNARPYTKACAVNVTEHRGGDGAFMDLAYYVCQNVLENYVDLYE